MLTIYNTLTQQKEIFKPYAAPNVNLYVCGVTVYDYCHIGHARTYSAMDTIIRYLQYSDYQVNYIRNITDIDDKIINRANDLKEDYALLAQRFTKAMREDFAALKLLEPNAEPLATAFIPQMIELISQLIVKEHAYVASNGDVYFSVRSMPDYGCLAHHNIDELESGSRVQVSEAKRDPLDFVLWKLAKPAEPAWDSPWGKGRPGWHTECAAMSLEFFGDQFDLHGGGRDLIFPHHENELAQAKGATGKPFAKGWLHGGFLQIDKEKMSKSLNNFVTIREILEQAHPEVLRYLFVASHYRSPLSYSADLLNQAKQALKRLYTAIRFHPSVAPIEGTVFEKNFKVAMDDDFNSPIALSVLFDLAHHIQRIRETQAQDAAAHAALLLKLGNVLGILLYSPDEFLQHGEAIDVQKVEALIVAREAARKNKDWAEADRIRQELTSMSIVIEDGADGTSWKVL